MWRRSFRTPGTKRLNSIGRATPLSFVGEGFLHDANDYEFDVALPGAAGYASDR